MIRHLIIPVTHLKKGDGDSFHIDMFFGEARRKGCQPALKMINLGEGMDYPLYLRKNVFQLAHIFQPDSNLVVSKNVREVLKQFAPLNFLKVVFETVYEFPYPIADFSHFETIGDWTAQQKFMKEAKDQIKLRERLNDYYELMAPMPYKNYHDPDNKKVIIESPRLSLGKSEIVYNVETLARFPVCGRFGFYFSPEAFRLCPETHFLSER